MTDANKFFAVFGRCFFALPDFFLSLFYPQQCCICQASVESRNYGIVCADCWKTAQIFDGSEIICDKCGEFLMFDGLKIKTFCRLCNDDFFDAARAVGIYDKALMQSILRLKKIPLIPKHLERLFLQSFQNSPFQDAELIIPIPLSKGRLARRGYNQAALQAKILARKINLPVDEKTLIRKIHTPKHRAGMDKKMRLESVENAFAVVASKNINGKNILLVDDVFTSGATVSNCAKVLKENGAEKVYVLTLARAT